MAYRSPTIPEILAQRNRPARSVIGDPFTAEEIELAKHAASEAKMRGSLYSQSDQYKRENDLEAKAAAYWIPEQANFFVPEEFSLLGPKLWRAEIAAAAHAVMLDRKFHAGNLQITIEREQDQRMINLKPYARAALDVLQPKFMKHLCTFGITQRMSGNVNGKPGMHCHLTDMQPKAARAAMDAAKYHGPFNSNPYPDDYQYQAAAKRAAKLAEIEAKMARDIAADVAEIDRACEAALRAKTAT